MFACLRQLDDGGCYISTADGPRSFSINFSGPVALPDRLLEAFAIAPFPRRPLIRRVLGVPLLIGARDPSVPGWIAWPCNERNLLAWVWHWAFITIQEATFQFRRVLRYLARPGHREQRR